MALAPGTKLGTYEIQAPLGAGGMGEVYRATDTKLGRDVALKVLPADMAHDRERLARFHREARAVAALNHPNVVTLYSVEECDGVHFLTMELIEGQPLDRLILASGLSIERITEIAGALAEALAAAHEKGIVHRDLKPANVMLTTDGRVKVLDFGLAKDVGAETSNDATLTSAGHTQAGVVMGTPAYMSPEQVSGRPLDHRTDIFSLGVLLHEMSTGKRPFDGSSSAELISAILRDDPPSVTDLRTDLPSDLARIVRRCLEKDPRHRMQTARDVSNEFRDLARTASRPMPTATSMSRAVRPPDSAATRREEGFWVAVLPFRYAGGNEDLKALVEGLSEEVITGLSRFSYLRVIARGSTAKYSSESGDVRTIGKEVGARYVMEGSLRQAGTKLRLAIQLVDAATGSHLWAQTYERTFTPETVFELQDDLVPRIVSTVADQYGVLPRSMSELLRGKAEDALTPHEAVLRAFSYFTRLTSEEHATIRRILENAVRESPDQGDCWAMLALMYLVEYSDGFNLLPNPLDRALAAAERSVDVAPTHALGHYAVAFVYFFRKEKTPFLAAVERCLASNPMDGTLIGLLGMLLHHAGDEERGLQMTDRAMQLNPNYPGLLRFTAFSDAYCHARYAEALEAAVRINMPGFFYAHAARAAALGQLGQREAARKAVKDVIALRPDFAAAAREEYAKWYDSEQVEHFMDGLRKAGLEIPEDWKPTAPGDQSSDLQQSASITDERKAVSVSQSIVSSPDSGEARIAEGFWVAVLPFKYGGSNSDLAALTEGFTDDIVIGLSKFSYLRVIARSSTVRYAREVVDVRTAAKELGARYVMEGSLRQAGAKVRIAVQLIDATTGASLWAETYDRSFSPESMLELLDDVVPRIVSTVADTQGILTHSMTDALRNRDPQTLTPYEAVLRSFGHYQRVNAVEHLAARTALENVVKQPPDRADCWANLGLLYREEYTHGFNLRPDPLGRALAASRRALDVEPTNHFAHAALASTLFFQRDFPGFRVAAERAIALNPLEGYSLGYLGMLIAYSGDWERGCALAARAMELNPNHPGWYWFPQVTNAYRQRDYPASLQLALKVNLPGFWRTQLMLAVAYAQLPGQQASAAKAVRELLKIKPDFALDPRQELKKWYDDELTDRMMEDLRYAGLKAAEE